MTEKHELLKQKQEQNFKEQERTIASMNEQIAILSAEKQLTLDEINKNKAELARLRKVLMDKKAEVDAKDEIIFALEQKIDALYDEMERLEEEIAMKNAIIKDLER